LKIGDNSATDLPIKTNEEYSSLVPNQTIQEYESLKQSIQEDGLYMPLIVNQGGVLLDGHHRYKACQELNVKPLVEVKTFDDPIYEKLFVVHANLKRRQLTAAQKVELGCALKPIYEEIARRNSLSNLRQNLNVRSDRDKDENDSRSTGSFDPLGRVNDVISKEVGLSRTTYQRGETVFREAQKIWNEQVRTGKISINKGYSLHKRNLKKEALLKSIEVANDRISESNPQLVQGDFVEMYGEFIEDNSIDLIFTDPPYGKEWISLYEDLAKVASRVLKIGGSLVTYVGHCVIPDVIHYMENAGLTYWWPLAVKLSGGFARQHHRGVSIKWKPLLWFVKGEKRNAVDFMSDYIESRTPEKVLHEWEQSTAEAEHVISRLTVENQVVFDPMFGSGTTGAAAVNLNRKFIGFEKDEEKFEIAKRRISAKTK
jgi:DNA modification methylase